MKNELFDLQLVVNIPGPKEYQEPLDQVEMMALSRCNKAILDAILSGKMERTIDYIGNYFVRFVFDEPSLQQTSLTEGAQEHPFAAEYVEKTVIRAGFDGPEEIKIKVLPGLKYER